MSLNRPLWIILSVLFLVGFAMAAFILRPHVDDQVEQYYSPMKHAQYRDPLPAPDVEGTVPVVVATPTGGSLRLALEVDDVRAVWYTAADAASRMHAAVEGMSPVDVPPVRLLQWGTDISLRVFPEYTGRTAHRLGASLLDTVLAVSVSADAPIEHVLLPAELHPDAGAEQGFTEMSLGDLEQAGGDGGVFIIRPVSLAEDVLFLERHPVDSASDLPVSERAESLLGDMMGRGFTADSGAGWPVPPELEVLSVHHDGETLTVEFNLYWWDVDSPFARAARSCLAATLGQLPEVHEIRIRAEQERGFRDAETMETVLEPIREPVTVISPEDIPGGEAVGEILMNAVGDVTLARRVREVMDEKGEDHPFEYAAPIFLEGDLTFCNLEAPLADSGDPLPGKGIWLRGSPDSVAALHRAGIDVVNIANNHILDFGRPAFLETIAGLREWGILPVGGGNNDTEAHQPLFWEGRGVRIAFLAYAEHADIFWDWDHRESFAAGPDLPGVARMDVDLMTRDVRRAAEEADAVVVSVHWGPEYVPHPPPEHREGALAVVSEGADAVLGHHPHVLQSVEIHRDRPLLYSLGNFIYDQEPLRRAETVIAQLRWGYDDEGDLRPGEIGFLPFRIREGQAVPAEGEEIDSIFDYLMDISRKWGTSLRRDGGVLYLDLPFSD